MKKNQLKILIAALTSALIGLVGIQAYWLKSAIALKEQEFKEHVQEALVGTVQKIEKVSKYQELTKQQTPHGQLPNYQPISYRQKTTIDTAIGNEHYTLEVEEQSIFETSDGKIVTKTFHKVKNQQGDLLHSLESQSNQEEMSLSRNRTDIMNELISEITTFQQKPLLERIDPHLVNAILKEELYDHGVKTKFNMGLFSGHDLVLKEKGVPAMDLLESPFKIRLFPGNFFYNQDHLSVIFPQEKGFLIKSMGGVISISSIFIIAIAVIFWITFATVVRQKKLAVVKNDFINNMTHELKTPISTISLACDILRDKDFPKTPERQDHYVQVITEENKRLSTLVENVLQSAVIDKGELKLKFHPLHIEELIDQVVGRAQVRIEQQNGTLEVEYQATQGLLDADRVHLTNVISNLVDNAIKYSGGTPAIKVITRNLGKGLVVDVQDNGIGIAKEELSKIFDNLYRVPTGNLHDVKGFGLGLSYVKAIVEQHQGSVKVASTLGKGSTFSIYLPFKQTT